eukprot:TRINITY_DN6139_c0_g1_i2.p1 TRINITY_DN6139_c0_g1~~TRINITY_DN6139_c0_g1_i2.p1  ORF type:complete len:478 (+),score=86.50 TRINITY_DN6139_c0_g1_i2:125-1558(+)
MAVFSKRSRSMLLPSALVLAVLGYLSPVTFLPGPASNRPPAHQTAALPGVVAAATGLAAAGLPAIAAVSDSPLAHGAEGDMEVSVVQAFAEKGAFAGLLLSTVLSWWRSTIGSGRATAEESEGKPLSFYSMGVACLSLIVLLSNRWYESGHFPLSNMYESLMFLAWGVTAVTIYFVISQGQESEDSRRLAAASLSDSQKAKQQTADIASTWASPVALGTVAFATLTLPKALQKSAALVPALQSNWLMMHVSVVMCSYATLMFGSVLCMAVLALSQPKDSPVNMLRNSVMPLLQGVANTFQPQQPVIATSPQVPAEAMPAAMTGSANLNAGNTSSSSKSSSSSGSSQVARSASVTVEFAQSSSGSANLSEDDQLALTLDDLAYRACLLGFGFLTVGIISGAVWANEAWGNYWSWDPKETWALIAWLVYAGYLHTRLQLGWDTRDSSKIGAFGFLVIWVCYIGVNLLGVGLHSYGFFLK